MFGERKEEKPQNSPSASIVTTECWSSGCFYECELFTPNRKLFWTKLRENLIVSTKYFKFNEFCFNVTAELISGN